MMTEDEKKDIERVKPWAGPLHALRHSVGDPRIGSVPIKDLLTAACKMHEVDYPPEDIEFTILRLYASWVMSDVPVPVEEGVWLGC